MKTDALREADDLLYPFMHSPSLESKYRQRYGLNSLQATTWCSPGSISTNNNNVQHTSSNHPTNTNMCSVWSCWSTLIIHAFIITCIQIHRKRYGSNSLQPTAWWCASSGIPTFGIPSNNHSMDANVFPSLCRTSVSIIIIIKYSYWECGSSSSSRLVCYQVSIMLQPGDYLVHISACIWIQVMVNAWMDRADHQLRVEHLFPSSS